MPVAGVVAGPMLAAVLGSTVAVGFAMTAPLFTFAPLIIARALIGIASFLRMNQTWFERIARTLGAAASLWLMFHG